MPRKKRVTTKTVSTKPLKKFLIVRDNREKVGRWNFIKGKYCEGTIDGTITTGDYTIENMQDIFAIERKKTTGELAGNVCTKQFVNELKRADKLKHFFVICEFSLQQILSFPYDSSIPQQYWRKLKMNAALLLRKIIEFECTYNVKFIFAGNADGAKEVARAIFKEMNKRYAS